MIVKATEFKILQQDLQKAAQGRDFISVKIRGEVDEIFVRDAFRTIFNKAMKAKRQKVVFPPVGIVEGFPVIGVAKIVSQEILRFCRAFPGALKEMNLVIEDAKMVDLFEKQVYGYLRHVQEDLGCGPYCTVDMIIEYKGGIVVIERTNPPYGFALPGGFVDNGETLEHAAVRETKEETNLDFVDFKQFHTYSDPARDPRFQTISTAFVGKGKGKLNAGDDAKGAQVIAVKDILDCDFAFDHKDIIRDYLKSKRRSR
jgi:8-oxo-dGTP diphosphatase